MDYLSLIHILAVAMAASLTACGGSSKPAETTAAAQTEAAAETEAKAEGAETPAAEGGVLKIGVIGPLTGPAAAYGTAVRNAVDMAVKEVNEAGGINGMTCLLYTSSWKMRGCRWPAAIRILMSLAKGRQD